MDFTMKEVSAKNNSRIKFGIIPGHFATNHSHVSCYIDLNGIKNSLKASREAAKELASRIYGTLQVDAIICIEGTRMVGAFMAEELSDGLRGINSGNEIYVITPEFGVNNQIILRDNIHSMVCNKNVLLLASSVSSGKSIQRTGDCIRYYGGTLVGVCAIFSALYEVNGMPVQRIFTDADIPEYATHRPSECPMCQSGRKIDALVNSFGFSKL